MFTRLAQWGLLVISLLHGSQLWADGCGIPYRLALQQEQELNFQGDEATLTLQLLDENGQLVESCEEQTIRLEITNPAKQITTKMLALPQGTSTLKVPVRLDSLGLYRFAAQNDRLYSAVLHLISKDPKALTDTGKSEIVRGGSSADQECPPLELTDRMNPWEVMLLSNVSAEGVPANGKDPAIIDALISSSQPYIDHDVEIILETMGGTFSTPSITIPRCKTKGRIELTSNKPGLVAVSFKKAVGAYMKPADAGQVEVEFIPPVKGVEIKAQEKLSLLEEGSIAVGLVDEDGQPVPSTKHPIDLRVSGNARLESDHFCTEGAVNSGGVSTLCLAEGMSHVDARLIPLSAGDIELDASAARLAGAQAKLQVSWPLLHLLLAVAGGAVAGAILMAFYARRQKQRGVQHYSMLLPMVTGAIGGIIVYVLVLGLGMMAVSIPAWMKTYVGSFAIAAVGGAFTAIITLVSGFGDSIRKSLIEPVIGKIRENRRQILEEKLKRLWVQHDLETRVEEKLRLKRIIDETEETLRKLC